jgi:hypothetical protein
MFAFPKPDKPMPNFGVGAYLVEIQKLCDDAELVSDEKGKHFGVVAHHGGNAGTTAGGANGAGPAQAPQNVPGWS